MNNNLSLQDQVKAFVIKTLAEVKINRDDETARVNAIRIGLGKICDEFTVEEYTFNLAMDVFVEAAYKNLSECLTKILDESDLDDFDDSNRNIAFAAYYALSLIHKKQDDVEGLHMLLNEKYDKLRDYALHFEVHSRYYKRVDMFRDALSCDKRAINVLKRKQITNVALCISYASTVCTMLKKKDTSIHNEDITLAHKYIEDAIEFNPIYPKYYFLKAQLTFLSAVYEEKSLSELEQAGRAADELIDEYADVFLYEFYHDRNVFVEKERKKYEDFKRYIDDIIERKRTPRFPKSGEELEDIRVAIDNSDSQDQCSRRPPVPALHNGDKYVFICYSSKDFKAVYSDLIELYKRKVPFKYDGHLPGGEKWQVQIESGIDNPDCIGVIFFLSKNVLSTNSVCDEIGITKLHGKKHQVVNLEGSTLPSRMLTDLLIERYKENPDNYYLSGDNMQLFLNFFDDSIPFTHRFDRHSHIDNLITTLTERFPEIIIGD